MSRTETITIFSDRSIAKNASSPLATPIYLGKCGPNTTFHSDVSASNAGQVTIKYKVGNSASDSFHIPSGASDICTAHRGGSTASRDRYSNTIYGTEWITFLASECGASNIVLDMSLIISQE